MAFDCQEIKGLLTYLFLCSDTVSWLFISIGVHVKCQHIILQHSISYVRRPAFTSLYSKQGQHCRRDVVVVEVPSLPSTIFDARQLVRVLVLKVLTSANGRHVCCK